MRILGSLIENKLSSFGILKKELEEIKDFVYFGYLNIIHLKKLVPF